MFIQSRFKLLVVLYNYLFCNNRINQSMSRTLELYIHLRGHHFLLHNYI